MRVSYVMIVFLAIAFCVNGCSDNRPKRTTDAKWFYAFVNTVPCTRPNELGEVAPVNKPSDRVLAYAEQHYDTGPGVRRAIARYFLLYDAALLKRGLIASDGGPGDLVGLLWDKEMARNARFGETPATGEMRHHIKTYKEWFALTERELKMIKDNDRALEKYIRWCIQKTGLHSRKVGPDADAGK